MSSTTHRVCRLTSRPVGLAKRSDFGFSDEPVPEPGPGQFRFKVAYLSIDPAMRGWIAEGRSYVQPVRLGDPMRAIGIGQVDISNHPGFQVGEWVVGMPGIQQYALSDGTATYKVDVGLAPPTSWIGGLGMPGLTAYFGLLEIGQPRVGETVVISAASGAVGSMVGQIARMKGCRTVGIAGGREKCAHVTDTLGFDACIDYKAGNLAADLKAATPDRVDIYFEGVGGEILDSVLARMNTFGRVPVCGLISTYNATEPVPGPTNFRSILVNRLTVRGFIVTDFLPKYHQALTQLGEWAKAGKLVLREDVREGGIDAFPETLNLLYSGGNFGKLVLTV